MLRYSLIAALILILIVGCSENDIIRYEAGEGVSLEFTRGTDNADNALWLDVFSANLTITEENNPGFIPIQQEVTVERIIDGQDTTFEASEAVEVPVDVFLVVNIQAAMGADLWVGETAFELIGDTSRTVEVFLTRPPVTPFDPQPANGQTGVDTLNAALFWDCNDPDGEAVNYRLDYGTTTAMANEMPFLQFPEYFLPGQFNPGATYYWQVTAMDIWGASTTGPVWTFQTAGTGGGPNQAPGVPYDPIPFDGETDVDFFDVWLFWSCDDPDFDPLTYSLWWGDTQAMNNFIQNINFAEYNLGQLQPGVDYYWQVEVSDGINAPVRSNQWVFTTLQ